MRILKLTLLLLLFTASLAGVEIRHRYGGRSFNIRSELTPDFPNGKPAMLSLLVPCPESSFYQSVSRFRASAGRILPLPDGNGKYVFWTTANPKRRKPLVRTFLVTVYSVKTNFSKLKTILPPSGKFPEYTGRSGKIVDPTHPQIRRIAAELSENMTDHLDYIRKAYVYVTLHFQYKNPGIGLLPLDQVLRNGGGDCGNLSSIFISLLRAKEIPARHLVGKRFDNTDHVWAEFYLENADWIPADVTADMGKGTLEHLGNIHDCCIVMHRGVELTVQAEPNVKRIIPFMQNYVYWYNGPEIKLDFTFCDPIQKKRAASKRKIR